MSASCASTFSRIVPNTWLERPRSSRHMMTRILKGNCAAALAGIFIPAVLLFGCARESDVWVVMVNAIPARYSARGAVDMETSYMLRQTHEPLFRRDDGENFQSRLLKKWSRSPDSARYSFCPDTGLVFSGARTFSTGYFESYISSVTRVYSPDFSMVSAGGCVDIVFRKPAPGYLRFLSGYEQAPSVAVSDRVEAGLGPFEVVEMSTAAVRLERKVRVSNAYNSILLRLYKTGEDISGDTNVADFNKVIFDKNWDTGGHFAFDAVEPRAVVLLINHPEKAVRSSVYNCLDIDAFNRAYVPSLGKFNYIGTVLPMGMVGAQWGRPAQVCKAPGRSAPSRPLVLANYQPKNDESLGKYLEGFALKTGIAVKAKRYSSKELIDLIKEKPPRQPYQLIVFMLDSSRNEYAEVLDYFYGDNTVIADMPASPKKAYRDLVREEDPGKREALARELAAFLADEHFALPLFQYSKTLRYPKNIKNINVGRGFIEYPEVADFRW